MSVFFILSFFDARILTFSHAVKLFWIADVVQETTFEGDQQVLQKVHPMQSKGIKFVVESVSDVDVSAELHFMWIVPHAASIFRRFAVGRYGQSMNEMCEGALFLLWRSSVSECGGCLCIIQQQSGSWIEDMSKEDIWDRSMDQTQCLLVLQKE